MLEKLTKVRMTELTVLSTMLYELGGRKTFQRAAMVTFHAVSCSEKWV